MKASNQPMKPTAPLRETSTCLPRRHAVAYLCLVRSTEPMSYTLTEVSGEEDSSKTLLFARGFQGGASTNTLEMARYGLSKSGFAVHQTLGTFDVETASASLMRVTLTVSTARVSGKQPATPRSMIG